LSTSERSETADHIGRNYLIVTAFCILFSAVYEKFSHGVYSLSMVCLCLYPFILGVLPFALFKVNRKYSRPEPAARNLWNSGVATLTAGSLIRGVVEIYGTTTPYASFYPAVGIALLLAALFLHFRHM